MRITSIEGDIAVIAAPGLEQRASLMLVRQARVGDYVLVHAGFAITVMYEAEAQDTLALFADIEAYGDDDLTEEPPAGHPDGAADGRH